MGLCIVAPGEIMGAFFEDSDTQLSSLEQQSAFGEWLDCKWHNQLEIDRPNY
jgi:hypothetical protein